MAYKLPLALRQRSARNQRLRYQRNPEYRLAQINARRARDGSPIISSLDEMGTQKPQRERQRDARGRFQAGV